MKKVKNVKGERRKKMNRRAMCAVPPMGWNSWNTFTGNINEDLIKETVDVMKEQGDREAGYEYVVMEGLCIGEWGWRWQIRGETLFSRHASGEQIR